MCSSDLGLVFNLLPLAAAVAQEDDRLPATLAALQHRPHSFDLDQLSWVASQQSLAACRGLIELFPVLREAGRRERLLREMRSFGRTPAEPQALDFLQSVLLQNPPPEECLAAAEALAACHGGPAALRQVAARTRERQVYLAALLHLIALEDTEQELLERWARGRLRLRTPAGDELLSAWEAQLRCAALRQRAMRPGTKSLLEELLNADERRVEACALELLARQRSHAAIRRARELLETDVDVLRGLRAIDVLHHDGRPASLSVLLSVARRPGELRGYALRTLTGSDSGVLHELVFPLLHRPAKATDALLALEIMSRDPALRVGAAIRGLLRHPDPWVQGAAIEAVIHRHDKAAAPTLRQLAQAEEHPGRGDAIVGLARLRPADPGWRKELHHLCRSPHQGVRLAALEAVAFLGDVTALPLLHAYLEADDWQTRSAAIEALKSLRSPTSIPFLIARLDRDRARLREDLASALRRISGQPFGAASHDWQRWWAAAAATFRRPPLDDVEAMEYLIARRTLETRADFYGLSVVSDHVAIVIDRSGSMAELSGVSPTAPAIASRMERARQEVAELLARLPARTRLNLHAFASSVQRWQPALRLLSPRRAGEAQDFAQSLRAEGGTNFLEALQSVLQDAEVDTVYLLSDGEPTEGELIDPLALRQAARRLNPGRRVIIHTIGVGPSAELLRQLAEDTGGQAIRR